MKIKAHPERGLFDSLSPFAKVLRVLLISGNLALLVFILFCLNNTIIMMFATLDQQKKALQIYNFLLSIPLLFYLRALYCGYFGAFKASEGFLNQYMLYSCVVIGQFIVFAIFWFLILTFLSYPSNQIEVGQKYFKYRSEQYIKDLMNCSDDQNIDDSYEKLNRFQSYYKCCGWNGSHDYNEMLNITEVMD